VAAQKTSLGAPWIALQQSGTIDIHCGKMASAGGNCSNYTISNDIKTDVSSITWHLCNLDSLIRRTNNSSIWSGWGGNSSSIPAASADANCVNSGIHSKSMIWQTYRYTWRMCKSGTLWANIVWPLRKNVSKTPSKLREVLGGCNQIDIDMYREAVFKCIRRYTWMWQLSTIGGNWPECCWL